MVEVMLFPSTRLWLLLEQSEIQIFFWRAEVVCVGGRRVLQWIKYRNLRCHWPLLCYLLQEFFWYWSTWGVNDKKIFFQKLETKCSKFDHWKVRKKSILVMCLISENNQGKVLFCGRENGILLTRHTVGRKTNSTHSFSWWRWIVGFFGSGSEAKKDFFSGRASRKQPAPEKMFQKGQPHHDVLGGLMTPQITVV